MILKKLQKIIKRHPFLYLTRFRLLSKNSDLNDIKDFSYNRLNSKEDIPSYFYDVNELIFKDGLPKTDLDKAKHLAVWLQENIKGGPGLSEPSDEALNKMLTGNGGVCSDMAQIFNNFCVINDIAVREWGTTSAPFNREFGGHSFNEIYSTELKKWVFIDVYWSFLFFNEEDEPLSVIEVYQFKQANKPILHKSFNQKKNLQLNTINRNYLNLNIIPFLICDYRNKTYDRFLHVMRPLVPIFIIHFVIYLFNKSYHYRFPLDDYKKIFS